MRYVLCVQYDGTNFSGFQRQVGKRTVQGELERAAKGLGATRVTGSGRTDAGVHAEGQICHFDGETSVPPERIAPYLNALLPPDLKVIKSAAAPEGFDCTRGAKKKTYVYTAYEAACALPLKDRYAARLACSPDLAKMEEAARLLCGEHNFLAFSSTGSSAKTSVRTLYDVHIVKNGQTLCNEYKIFVTGNGFLYHMVRILAGEIFAVGCGKSTENIRRAFATGERSLIAKTMPAAGLTLKEVDYGVPLFGTSGEG